MKFPAFESSAIAVKWINEVLKKSTAEIDADFRKFRIPMPLWMSTNYSGMNFSGWYRDNKPEYGNRLTG
jgi:hypothetical protein